MRKLALMLAMPLPLLPVAAAAQSSTDVIVMRRVLAPPQRASGGTATPTASPTPSATPTASPTPTPSEPIWTGCGSEEMACDFSGTTMVRYGTQGDTFSYQQHTDGVACSYKVFGDPAPGAAKHCEYDARYAKPQNWIPCADYDQTCKVPALTQVRFGAAGYYIKKTVATQIACTVDAFGGDPYYGGHKSCDYEPFAGDAKDPQWAACASSGEACIFNGTTTVRYGASGSYAYVRKTGFANCTPDGFGGDPAPGVTKSCDIDTSSGASVATVTWTRCGAEDDQCSFGGDKVVRYGVDGHYAYRSATDGIRCSYQIFGDPAPGLGKHCDVASTR